MQVNHMITERLRTKGKETLDYLKDNKQKAGFIKDFFTPFLVEEPITLKKEESADGTKMIDTGDSLEKQVKEFVDTYISSFQSLYDLIPFFCYIVDDPYQDKSEQSKALLQSYLSLCKLTRVDLIQRIMLVCISDKTFSNNNTNNVIFDRVEASEFKLLNRHEKQGESKTLFSMLYSGM